MSLAADIEADVDRAVDEDELLADTTIELLTYLQQRRSIASLTDAVVHAHAMHAAAMAFQQVEVGVDGVRKMLDAAIVENDRQRARNTAARVRR